MRDVQSVAKKDRNDFQKFNFRGIDAVVNAVGPALREHSVVVVPHVDSVTYDAVSTTKDKSSTACRVVVTYTFHHGESSLSATVAAEAWDSGDKAAPKAMSVAFRTALLQALALPTDEPDPDSHTYERAAVDLSALEDAITVAQDLGVTKTPDEWRGFREYAAQSQAHADKALSKLKAAMDEAGAP